MQVKGLYKISMCKYSFDTYEEALDAARTRLEEGAHECVIYKAQEVITLDEAPVVITPVGS